MDLTTLTADAAARDWDTNPDGTVRMAVVGLGGFARKHALPAIAAADYCDPSVVVTGSSEKGERVADAYDATALSYQAYEDGAAVGEYDAVYVATPNRLHLPHVETAVDHDKAVIVEKPLEATVSRAERLVTTCEEAGVPLMTAYRLQADPLARRLREFVQAGGLGEVVEVWGDFTFPALESGGPDQWRLDAELAGGGALMDVGVYPLNTSRFVLGTDPATVDGYTRGDGPFAHVDEHVEFHAEFPGAVGSFSAGFSGARHNSFGILGTEGSLRVEDAFWPDSDRRLVVEHDDGQFDLGGLGVNDVREEFDYFAHAVLTGRDIEPSGADGLRDVEIMDAVYRAAQDGERTDV